MKITYSLIHGRSQKRILRLSSDSVRDDGAIIIAPSLQSSSSPTPDVPTVPAVVIPSTRDLTLSTNKLSGVNTPLVLQHIESDQLMHDQDNDESEEDGAFLEGVAGSPYPSPLCNPHPSPPRSALKATPMKFPSSPLSHPMDADLDQCAPQDGDGDGDGGDISGTANRNGNPPPTTPAEEQRRVGPITLQDLLPLRVEEEQCPSIATVHEHVEVQPDTQSATMAWTGVLDLSWGGDKGGKNQGDTDTAVTLPEALERWNPNEKTVASRPLRITRRGMGAHSALKSHSRGKDQNSIPSPSQSLTQGRDGFLPLHGPLLPSTSTLIARILRSRFSGPSQTDKEEVNRLARPGIESKLAIYTNYEHQDPPENGGPARDALLSPVLHSDEACPDGMLGDSDLEDGDMDMDIASPLEALGGVGVRETVNAANKHEATERVGVERGNPGYSPLSSPPAHAGPVVEDEEEDYLADVETWGLSERTSTLPPNATPLASDPPPSSINKAPDAAAWRSAFPVSPAPTRIRTPVQRTDVETYEETCQRCIQLYLREAKEQMKVTALSARVQEWAARVDVQLKLQDAHPPFDMASYSAALYERITSVTSAHIHGRRKKWSEPTSGKPYRRTEEGSAPVSFSEVLAPGCRESYEVSRMFLAALQLTNRGLISIVPQQNSLNEGVPTTCRTTASFENPFFVALLEEETSAS